MGDRGLAAAGSSYGYHYGGGRPQPAAAGAMEAANKLPVKLPTEVLLGYRLIRCIGEGTYGKVFLAQVMDPNLIQQTDPPVSFVALKVLPLTNRTEGVPPTTMRESALLKELNHENVIKMHNIHVGPEAIVLVFEFCTTDLGRILEIHSKSDVYLGRAYVRSLMTQILRGLQYIHSEGILHRDLKPQNLLMTEDYTSVKIADFGLSRTFGLSPSHEQKNCTAITLWYRPPEVLLGHAYYSTAAEIWSVGCLFAELLVSRTILHGDTETEQLRQIFYKLNVPTNIKAVFPEIDRLIFLWKPLQYQGVRLKDLLPHVVDEYAADLLLKMLEIDPARRITLEEALKHPFIADAEAAVVIDKFVPYILPSTFSDRLNEIVPKLRVADVGVATPVDDIYRSEVARLARRAVRKRLWLREHGSGSPSPSESSPAGEGAPAKDELTQASSTVTTSEGAD